MFSIVSDSWRAIVLNPFRRFCWVVAYKHARYCSSFESRLRFSYDNGKAAGVKQAVREHQNRHYDKWAERELLGRIRDGQRCKCSTFKPAGAYMFSWQEIKEIGTRQYPTFGNNDYQNMVRVERCANCGDPEY